MKKIERVVEANPRNILKPRKVHVLLADLLYNKPRPSDLTRGTAKKHKASRETKISCHVSVHHWKMGTKLFSDPSNVHYKDGSRKGCNNLILILYKNIIVIVIIIGKLAVSL